VGKYAKVGITGLNWAKIKTAVIHKIGQEAKKK
jgi:hypothetical protein